MRKFYVSTDGFGGERMEFWKMSGVSHLSCCCKQTSGQKQLEAHLGSVYHGGGDTAALVHGGRRLGPHMGGTPHPGSAFSSQEIPSD